MGNGKLKAAIIDSGPIIHLNEINCLRLLSIFESIHLPGAVWLETVGKNHISQEDLSSLTNIQRHSLSPSEVSRFIQEKNLTLLHAGEQECLCLCRKTGISTLLTDDLAVRDSAKLLKIKAVGSLGIVVSAYMRQEITLQEAERYISDLHDVSSLFVTREIADLAIEQLRNRTIL